MGLGQVAYLCIEMSSRREKDCCHSLFSVNSLFKWGIR